MTAPSFASVQTRRFSTTSVSKSAAPTPGPSALPSAGLNQTATIQPHESYRPTGVPDFSAYRVKGSGETHKTLSYFMVGTMGVLAASGAKSTVSDILSNMAASADVLALAKIEVEMGAIPEGEWGLLHVTAIKSSGRGCWAQTRAAAEVCDGDAMWKSPQTRDRDVPPGPH